MVSRKLVAASTVAAVSAVIGVFTVAVAQQRDFSKVEIKSEKLADNLYRLEGAGGNIGLLIGPDGAVIVDDQFAPLSDKIKAAIAKITDKPVKFVLNTHFHFDHTGGNEAFGRSGSIIIAHDNTRKRLSQETVITAFNVKTPPAPKEALPVVTFADSLTVHLNGEEVSALHVPNAHTDTDVVLFFKKANVMHTGDVFAASSYPFIDGDNGGSIDGVIAAADTILKVTKPDTRFLRGHSPMGTRADLEEFRQMLVTVRKRVSDAIKEGKTQEQLVASKPTKDFDAKFGSGNINADVFVQRVFVDLRRGGGNIKPSK
jgi:cyclase